MLPTMHERVDSTKTNMGLMVWKNSPKGKIRESHVVIAKNVTGQRKVEKYLPSLRTLRSVIAKQGEAIHTDSGLPCRFAPSNDELFFADQLPENYLNEKELDHLNRIVTLYLDCSEMQAQKGIAMRMGDLVKKLNKNYISDFNREVKKLN